MARKFRKKTILYIGLLSIGFLSFVQGIFGLVSKGEKGASYSDLGKIFSVNSAYADAPPDSGPGSSPDGGPGPGTSSGNCDAAGTAASAAAAAAAADAADGAASGNASAPGDPGPS